MVSAFLYSLAGGALGVVATAKPADIAWKFLRLVGVLALVVACAAYIYPRLSGEAPSSPPHRWLSISSAGLCAGAIGLVLLAPLMERMPSLFRVMGLVGGLCGLAGACLSVSLPAGGSPPLRVVVIVISELLGGMLLGSISVAWLLGHAYLTATKMTIAPLRHFSRLLIWSVALRAVFALVSLLLAWSLGGTELAAHLRDAWLIVSLRLGLGLAGVGVFAYMVSDCVKLRATQSATGILYFGSLFAYIGELAHQYLIVHYGWGV